MAATLQSPGGGHLRGARRRRVPVARLGQLVRAPQARQNHKRPAVCAQMDGAEEEVLGCRVREAREQHSTRT